MRPTILIFVAITLFIFPATLNAQDTRGWRDGCDPHARAAITSATDVLDYDVACEQFRSCDPDGEVSLTCQMETLQYMLAQCPAGDTACENGALLSAAAILAYHHSPGVAEDWSPPQSVIEGVPAALHAYWQGDYEAALAAYDWTPAEDNRRNMMLPFSRGVILQLLDRPEAALNAYDAALEVAFDHPLAWYARSQLYGSLERDVEAAIDVAALSAFLIDEPALEPLVESLQSEYPLSAEIAEWQVYPITTTSVGPSGYFVNDRILEPPRPVQIGVFPELDMLVGIGLQHWSLGGKIEPEWRLHRLTTDDGITYSVDYPLYFDQVGGIEIVFEDDMIRGVDSFAVFGGAAAWEFALTPTGEPDPRENLPGIRHCGAGVRSRVREGMRVNGVRFDRGIQYADRPGGEIVDTMEGRDSTALIIGGPECVEDVTWWHAELDNGVTGWIAENRDSTYMLEPVQAD